jgi:hypothetical protein
LRWGGRDRRAKAMVGVARFELATPASRTLGYTKEING